MLDEKRKVQLALVALAITTLVLVILATKVPPSIRLPWYILEER